MKKIFSILLSLALLVSLGVVTAAPVAAVTNPSISPTSATFNLNAPAQVTTTITWGSATTLLAVDEVGVGNLSTPGDYELFDSLLVIKSGYLVGALNWIGDSVTLVLVFDVGTCVLTITANFVAVYDLTISSTAGGSVTTPGEGTFTYDAGTVVGLVATPATGYGFVNWAGDVGTIANVNAATTTITMQGNYNITARFLPHVVAAKTQTVTNSTVDAIAEADTEVVVKGTATVTIAKYASNPHPPSGGGAPASLDLLALDTFREVNIFRDVCVINTTPGTEIEIRLYYTDGEVAAANVSEESLRLFWWNNTAWVQCSDSGANTTSIYGYSGYMWAKITATTTPRLADLQGTEFGGYGHPSETPQPWCFIATAAYGTATAKELDILREFRDEVLLPNSLGAKLVSLYYKISPPIANFIFQHEVLRTVVRVGFVDSFVRILSWSHDLWSAGGS